MGPEGRLVLLLDSMSTGGVGGKLAHVGLHSEHLSSAVLKGGECRRRSPQSLLSDGHLYSNLLRLAVHGNFHVVLVLGHFHGNPLGLGVRVLGCNKLGVGEGGVFSILLPQQAPQTRPWVIARRRSS